VDFTISFDEGIVVRLFAFETTPFASPTNKASFNSLKGLVWTFPSFKEINGAVKETAYEPRLFYSPTFQLLSGQPLN
jgi:hypothetical protein